MMDFCLFMEKLKEYKGEFIELCTSERGLSIPIKDLKDIYLQNGTLVIIFPYDVVHLFDWEKVEHIKFDGAYKPLSFEEMLEKYR